MKRLSLRLVVAILTFAIGVSSVLVWLTFYRRSSNQQTNRPSSNANSSELKTDNLISEEYAVYSAALSDNANPYLNSEHHNLIVIIDHTDGYLPLKDNGIDRMQMGCLRGEASALSSEVLDDYLSKNEKSYPLTNLFTAQINCALISEDEMEKLNWAEFAAKFPNSSGTTTLSRVGFNHGLTQAMVYITNNDVAGVFVFLTKENGIWTIHHKACGWVS